MKKGKYEIRLAKDAIKYLKRHNLDIDTFCDSVFAASIKSKRKIKIPLVGFNSLKGVEIEIYTIRIDFKTRAICSYDWDEIHETNLLNVYCVCSRDDLPKCIRSVSDQIRSDF